MNYTIRKGTKEDADTILNLIKELADFEHSLSEVSNTNQQIIIDCFGVNSVCNFLIAEHEQKAVGMAAYYTSYSTWVGKCLYLEDIIVSEKYRGQGIGQALFDQMITLAKDGKYMRLEWQVLNWNKQAIDFYKKYDSQFLDEWLPCRLNYAQLQKIKVQL